MFSLSSWSIGWPTAVGRFHPRPLIGIQVEGLPMHRFHERRRIDQGEPLEMLRRQLDELRRTDQQGMQGRPSDCCKAARSRIALRPSLGERLPVSNSLAT